MDKLAKWSARLADLRSLFAEWERRRHAGAKWTRRFREIHSICMFTLLIENMNTNRYLIGFQQHGIDHRPIPFGRLFDDDFGEIEDCDILLVDDPKAWVEAEVLHHECQLVSYLNQPSTSEKDFVAFLEKKKLIRPPDSDLRLIIHVEQTGQINYHFLWAYLMHRQPACPYSQVFIFGQCGVNPRRWFCVQVYPELVVLHELDEDKAKNILIDRIQYNKS